MRNTLLVIPLLAASVAHLCAWQQTTTPSDIELRLHSSVNNYALDTDNTQTALIAVASDFKLPMGIEWIKSADRGPGFRRSWPQTTVAGILKDITETLPGYEMSPDDGTGVVHVRPSTLRSDTGDIVNARVGAFAVKNEFVNVASRRLQQIAGGLMAPPDPSKGGGGQGSSIGTGMGDRAVTLSVKDGTVRNILDQLCQAADLKIWIVAYPTIQSKTNTGFIRTALLFIDAPIEDQWQPIWHFQPWNGAVK